MSSTSSVDSLSYLKQILKYTLVTERKNLDLHVKIHEDFMKIKRTAGSIDFISILTSYLNKLTIPFHELLKDDFIDMFRIEVYENVYVWKDFMLGQFKTEEQLKNMKKNAYRSTKQFLIEYIWPPKNEPISYRRFTRAEHTIIINEYNSGRLKDCLNNKVRFKRIYLPFVKFCVCRKLCTRAF